MKKLMFLALMMAFGLGATAQRVRYAPIYDGLSVYSSGNSIPLVWNVTSHELQLSDTTEARQYAASQVVKGTLGKGFIVKYTNGNTVAFTGVGKYNSGEINLFDSTAIKYYKMRDTLGAWTVNSYKPLSFRIRDVRAMYIDTTTNRVTVDSTLVASSGMVIGATTIFRTGTGSPESVVTAPIGSLWLRTDGSTSTTLYIKTSGAGNTGWTAK